ncbi:hypothetical protein HPP92_002756 [Vanilla planifolia]|uniref:Uncharacterized protein n=1 Tax=Vanilla planifolia TaxID=51239 RepID=A0A835S233_VANPL|nr:hypothetical protein HPP92_002756 [Vanilla planifolia]
MEDAGGEEDWGGGVGGVESRNGDGIGVGIETGVAAGRKPAGEEGGGEVGGRESRNPNGDGDLSSSDSAAAEAFAMAMGPRKSPMGKVEEEEERKAKMSAE